MTGLEPISSDDQFAQLTEAVRAHNMAQIKELLAALKPYVEGMFGPINPGHVRVYLEALKQLGMYVKAFDRPAEKDPDEGLEAALESFQRAVAKQDTALRRYHLAMAYLKAGNLKQGEATLRAAVKSDPNLP